MPCRLSLLSSLAARPKAEQETTSGGADVAAVSRWFDEGLLGGFWISRTTRRVPKPLLFFASTTALPEKMEIVFVAGMATGNSVQCTQSVLTACPQEMVLAHVVPNGLYWKNRWCSP